MPLCIKRGYGRNQVRVYSDNDISAYSGKARPGYREMLRDIEAGEVKFVAVWHTDRLWRRLVDLEEFIEVAEGANCHIATAKAGELNLDTAAGRMNARILGSVARGESEHMAERIALLKKRNRELGKPNGGPRPFGWARRPVLGRDGKTRESWDPMKPDRKEAELIRKAVDDLLAGASLADIARRWTNKKVPKPQLTRPRGGGADGDSPKRVSSSNWTVEAVRQVVSNPRNAGLIGHRMEMAGRKARGYLRYAPAHKSIVGKAKWPAIVDPARWESLMAVLEHRGRLVTMPKRRSLLTGVLTCGICGGPMVRATTGAVGKRRAAYRCPSPNSGVYRESCGRLSIDAAGVEDLLIGAYLAATDDSDRLTKMLANGSHDDGVQDLTASLRALEVRLAQAAESFAAGKLSIDAYERVTTAAEAEKDKLRQVLARVTESTALTPLIGGRGSLRDRWASFTQDQRRSLLRSAFEKVVIKPGRRGNPAFDASRVDIDWRI